jgi:hypothetical protein
MGNWGAALTTQHYTLFFDSIGPKPSCDDAEDIHEDARKFTTEEKDATVESWGKRYQIWIAPIPSALREAYGWQVLVKKYRLISEQKRRNRQIARDFYAWNQQQLELVLAIRAQPF